MMDTIKRIRVTKNGTHNNTKYKVGQVFENFRMLVADIGVMVFKENGDYFILDGPFHPIPECEFIHVPVVKQNYSYSIF